MNDETIKDVFETRRARKKNGKRKAVLFVIIAELFAILQDIWNQTSLSNGDLRIHTPTLPSDNDDSVFHSNAKATCRKIEDNRYRQSVKVRCRRTARSWRRHDMQWATHVVPLVDANKLLKIQRRRIGDLMAVLTVIGRNLSSMWISGHILNPKKMRITKLKT